MLSEKLEIVKHNNIHSKYMYLTNSITSFSEKSKKSLRFFALSNMSLSWIIIPSLIIASSVLAIGLLFSAKLTFMILAFILVFLAIFIEPFVGVLLYIISLYVRPMELMDITYIPLMKILALSILASWFLYILVRRKREFVNAPQNILIIAFLGVIILSKRMYIQGMFNELTGDFARIVVIYFLMINLITNEKRLEITIWILLISTLWLSIHGILLSMGIAIGPVELSKYDRITSSGIFSDPNDLAQAIVVAIPLVFNFFFNKRSILIKIFLVVIGAIMLYAFLLTGSRGGFIGLSVVTFLLLRKKVGTIIGSAVCIAALVGLLLVAPSNTVERVKTTSPYEDTGASRLALWYEAWQMFLSNPILGVGKDNSIEYSASYHVPHNSFIHVAAELGIPGIILWIGIFYFSFMTLIKARKLHKDETKSSQVYSLSDSLMVSMIGFTSTALFLSRQYSYLPYILMALSVGVYGILSKTEKLKLTISSKEILHILILTFVFFVWWFGVLKVFL